MGRVLFLALLGRGGGLLVFSGAQGRIIPVQTLFSKLVSVPHLSRFSTSEVRCVADHQLRSSTDPRDCPLLPDVEVVIVEAVVVLLLWSDGRSAGLLAVLRVPAVPVEVALADPVWAVQESEMESEVASAPVVVLATEMALVAVL